ncbi:MAG TPA: NepR family anti-sigma factor [Stellaceae bacterium]|nr:NepR family anti-sigma factor [Stellaceae bacterium]
MTRKDRHPGPPGTARRRGAPRGRAAAAAELREVEEIRAFLTGRTNGGSLLHALYDHILDEPVPTRLRTLLEK